ncbi:hypothetical protein BH11CYA1_BH11CYA1_15260 [soil metagenome]
MAEKKNSPASAGETEARRSEWVKRQVLKLSLRWTPAIFCSLAMTFSLAGNLCPAAQAQSADTASLRKISVDSSNHIVFEFASGGVKASPKLFEMPAPDHRLIIDLPSTEIDTSAMPSADAVSAEINRVFPAIKSVRFLTPLKDVPTVRVAFDLAIPDKVKAELRILDGAVSLGLNSEFTQPVSAGSAAPQAASAPTAVADVYSQYAKALVAQNPEQPDDKGEWGPRKGTASELKGVTQGFKPLVSTAALNTPLIQADLNAALLVAKAAAKPAETELNTATDSDANASASTAASTSVDQDKPDTSVQLRDTTPDVQITAAAATAAPTTVDEAAQAIEREAVVTKPATVVKRAVAPVQRTAPVVRAAAKATGEPEPEVAMARTGESAAQAPSNEDTNNTAAETPAAPEQPASAPAVSSDATSNPKIQARRFFNKAVKEHLSGQVAQAIADYKAALALDTELGDAHSNLGLAYNQQHNYANALTEFRKALAVNPSDAITYNGVGAALRAQKDILGAIKNWETSVKLNPKLAVAHYNLGTAYESQGDLDRALVSYESATRNDQRLGEAFYRMGLIMMKKHKSEDAKEQFKRALKISENSDYSEDARLKLAFISKTK